MKNKKNKAPQDYTLEEILAEAKVMHGNDAPSAENEEPAAENSAAAAQSNPVNDANRFGGKSYAELIGEPEDEESPKVPHPQPAPSTPTPEQPAHPQPSPEITTPVMPEMPQPSQPAPSNGIRFEQEQEEPQEPKKRRGLFGLFGRKHKDECAYDADEEDIYYGMQLKPIDEYKKGYDENTDSNEQTSEQQNMHPTATFAYLFDETNADDVGDEIAARFDEIHRERQKRVEEVLNGDELPKIQPLYDHTTDKLNIPPKPIKANTEKEIYSYSPKTESKNTQAAAVTAPHEEPQPKAKPIPKKKNKPVVAQKFVDNKKTTEFFMQIPKRRLQVDSVPKVELPKAAEFVDKTPNTVEPTDFLTQIGIRRPTEAKPISQAAAQKLQVAKPIPKAVAQEVQVEKPISQAAAQEVQVEKPISQAVAQEVQVEKPIPQAVAQEVQVEKPIPQAAAQEVQAEKPVSQAIEQEVQAEKPISQAVAQEVQAEKPISQAAAQEVQVEKPISQAAAQEVQVEKPVSQAAAQEPQAVKTTDTEKPLDRKQRIKAVMDAAPKYLPVGKPVHVIELDNLRAVLESEAQGYAVAVKAEPKERPHLTPIPPIPTVKSVESNPEIPPQILDDVPQKSEKQHKGIHKFNITGEEEEEDLDQQEELPEVQEELDDYNDPSDAPSISNELGATIRELLLRFLVTGICTALLLVFGFLGEKYQLLPKTMAVQLGTTAYFVLNLSFLVIAMAFCWATIMNGIKALVTFQANSDSSVAVAAIAALAQSILAFFIPSYIMNGSIHLYSALAVGALFLNTAGKLSMIKRINRNFHFVSSPEPKQSVELFDDYNTALQMAKGCVADTPVIAYQCKTKFFKEFLNNSYEPDPSETASQSIAPVAFICSLVLCIVCLVLTKDVSTAITVFAAAACVCTPVTNMLSVNLPISSLCKFARKCGAMVVGYPTVEQFCNTNAVMLDAKDLFPKGTVVLNGIKTFGGQRIDEAIVDATALMCSVGGPLSDVFDQIIKNRRDMLPKIDNPVYEDERGVIGWVSGRRILVGNRDLMAGHGIEPPSRDYEEKYLLGGKQIVYLASGGDLVAMFVLSYNSDKRRALELQRMENNGISLIVRTCDPNITPEFLATCFQLDTHSVRVLPERLGSIYKEAANAELPHTAALLATKGRPTTMLRMLTACVRQKSNVSLAVAMQNVAIVLGFVLVAFLACYSGLKQISTAFLLLYEAFWTIVVLVIPRLRKP